MKYTSIKSLFLAITVIAAISLLNAADTHEIADEIELLKQNDPYIKTRLSIEDEKIKEMLDDVQRAKLAALATENKKFKQFLFNILPIKDIAAEITTKGLVAIDTNSRSSNEI